jgi:hypothetical protein
MVIQVELDQVYEKINPDKAYTDHLKNSLHTILDL